jgi:hypothetical protein
MRSGRAGIRPPTSCLFGARMPRSGTSGMRLRRSSTAENLQAMRNRRFLIATSPTHSPARSAAIQRPAAQAWRRCHPRRCREDINVLRHDLQGAAPSANITTVERKRTHSSCSVREHAVAQAGIDHRAGTASRAAFICLPWRVERARRRPELHPSRSPARCAGRQCCMGRTECAGIPTGGCDGSQLHPSAKSNNVLAIVYSGSGASRGKCSGGVGKRDAGDGCGD